VYLDFHVLVNLINTVRFTVYIAILPSYCVNCVSRVDNPNAFFCLRDSSFVKDLPADKLSKFVDKEPLNKYHLKVGVKFTKVIRL